MFRTELTIAPAAGQLPRTARVLTMGSCFADSIGARLAAHKVETRVNPFGTVFQPLALARLLRAAAGEEVDWQQHLVQARGRWQSYDLHGSVGADSPVELLQYIQEVVRQTGEFLRNTDLVLLTLGTAWAYRLRETGELVSNCHKQPADLFVRELLTPDEIINALAETHAYLRRINPDLRFVLTVSPVRHLKDTLPLNSVSKSVLRVATHIVSDLLPGVAYFPAFELLTDDLRDYRFYAADMLHPSEVAEDYIWDKFARTYFDADFGRFRKEWTAVRQSLGHRPLHEGAPEHRQFLESTREKLEQLSLRKIDVADELRTVRARLDALPLPVQPAPVPEPEDDEERIDIGEGASAVATSPLTAISANDAAHTEPSAANSGRPPRLSPEEFRAQRAARPERGRRDGRGKGQAVQPSEIEQFQAASFGEADEFVQQPFLTELASVNLAPVASAPEVTVGAPDAAADAAALEAGRKKKRRSRGGAKRTARKHALRLAAEMGLNEGQLPAAEAALEAAALAAGNTATVAPVPETPTTAAEGREPRRDRHEGGRGIARVPLFAAPAIPAMDATAEASEDSAASTEATADSEQSVPVSSSRKNRNRKKKKGNRPAMPESGETDQSATLIAAPRGAVEAVVDQETLNAARNDNQRDNRRPQAEPVATLPVPGVAGAVAATPVVLVSAPSDTSASESGQVAMPVAPKAAKPSKRKSRAMVGGRTVKPDVDTPVIPVMDASVVRTQVAAGRLMGSSASLVEPTAPVKASRVASPAKPVTSKGRGTKAPSATTPAAEAESPTAPTAPQAPATSAATAEALPLNAAQPVKKAKVSKAAAKAAATPEVTPEAATAAFAAPTAATTAKAATKKGVAKAPATTKAASATVPKPVVAAPQPAAASQPATAKSTRKAPASPKPAAPAVKPAAKTTAAKPAPKAAAAAKASPKAPTKAVKTAAAAAEQPVAAPKTAPKPAAKKAAPKVAKAAAPAKADGAKAKASKKSAS
ncbi:GSCFA domain-containing protein [Hymenobacter sp. DH14]|uniref:GSCFA domain-containing protein n=1 Tax=Hymenobacter cyanobacteriorum TaxID=2926463 RepID=A0A9X1VDC0_9BACT|nr:GSCFA domain-containing protein [Hymenobacter cyanobacteriorum]MCI1186493.1 GSCFA domain-containing protein [Hymenobacter cyanobacteriorum]